jgi:hypothetical protein
LQPIEAYDLGAPAPSDNRTLSGGPKVHPHLAALRVLVLASAVTDRDGSAPSLASYRSEGFGGQQVGVPPNPTSARACLIVNGSSALNLRYFGLWNPSNRNENIVAVAALPAHDVNL